METVTLTLNNGALHDVGGTYIGAWNPDVNVSVTTGADKTVELVKLGVSPDDIIKLKTQGLL